VVHSIVKGDNQDGVNAGGWPCGRTF